MYDYFSIYPRHVRLLPIKPIEISLNITNCDKIIIEKCLEDAMLDARSCGDILKARNLAKVLMKIEDQSNGFKGVING